MNTSSEKSNQEIRTKIETILNSLPELPSIPTVVSQALTILDNPKANINQLAEVISRDMALTTQILKLVNSAYYGFPSQITSINKAMALLGFNKIKSLIMSVAIKPMLVSSRGKALWFHSLRCAVGCQHLSKSLGYGDPEDAFVMGLLHDIGKTVMQAHNNIACKEIEKFVSMGADILDTEMTFFGFTHTQVGRILVEKWNLPVVIGITAEHHHDPLCSEESMSASIVYVADRITQDHLKYPIFDPEIIDSFDYEVSNPEDMRKKIFELSQPIIDALS